MCPDKEWPIIDELSAWPERLAELMTHKAKITIVVSQEVEDECALSTRAKL
jgi:hypothetical protein